MTSASERREHARLAAALPLEIEVEIHGFDDHNQRFRARGQTVNMSRGGLLALLDCAVEPGTHCLAHFPGAEGVVDRTMIYGQVKRATPVDDIYEVAVIFDTPLGDLRVPPDVDGHGG